MSTRREIAPDAEQTYFAMRLGLFLLVVLLGIAIVSHHVVEGGQLCASLSAYYYTSVRPVFVGILCAIGAALVFYRAAQPLENSALDFAGFAALVVAFVPTGSPAADSACATSNVPTATDLDQLVLVAVPGLLAVAAIAVVVGQIVLERPTRRFGPLTTTALAAVGIVVVVFFGWRSYFRPAVDDQLLTAHNTAAIILFAFMLLTIVLNARKGTPRYATAYRGLAVVMVGGCLAMLALGRVFWAEAVGIGGFGAFWLVQTIELQRRARRAAEVLAQPSGPGDEAVGAAPAGP